MYVISYLFPRNKSDSIQFDIMTSLINALELQILCHQLQPLTRFINLWGLWMQCRQNTACRLSKLAESVVGASPHLKLLLTVPPALPSCGPHHPGPEPSSDAWGHLTCTKHPPQGFKSSDHACPLSSVGPQRAPTAPPASCPTCPGRAPA